MRETSSEGGGGRGERQRVRDRRYRREIGPPVYSGNIRSGGRTQTAGGPILRKKVNTMIKRKKEEKDLARWQAWKNVCLFELVCSREVATNPSSPRKKKIREASPHPWPPLIAVLSFRVPGENRRTGRKRKGCPPRVMKGLSAHIEGTGLI